MTMEWAALVTWVVTAGFGFFMLATWARAGGVRTDAGEGSHFPQPVVFGHFLLAAAGLVVWIIYLATDSGGLAWVALAMLVVVAGAGDLLVVRWLRDRRGGPPATSGAASGGGTTTRTSSPVTLAEQRIPSAAVVCHGLFAVATVVLVLLVAVGVGG
jgi:hypothetical protein